MVDWDKALMVGGTGIVNVFLILLVLAIAIYIVGFFLRVKSEGRLKR